MRVIHVLAISLFCTPCTAAATPRIQVFVVGSAGGAAASREPVQARIKQKVTLYAVVGVGTGRAARYYTDAPSLRIAGRRVPARRLRPIRSLASRRFQWYLVEPYQHHKHLKPPNKGNLAYSNAVLFGPKHGRWLGYDRLEYHETRLAGRRSSSLAVDRAQPTNPKLKAHGGLGTMRYKVVVRLGALEFSSPGATAVGRRGILGTVMRVSFREADDFVGYLTSYFNVPNLFGSAGPGRLHQTEQYQGADCADVITGGARRAGARVPYTSAAGLRKYAPAVTPRLLLNRRGVFRLNGKTPGKPVTLRWGRDVKRGDLMLIDYVGFVGSPRSWDHIAVLSGDAGVKGVFDPSDLVIHVGYLYGLVRTRAREEGPAVIQVLRFNARIQRAFLHHQRRLKRRT